MSGGNVRVTFDADTSGLRKGVTQATGVLKDFQGGAAKAKGAAEILGGMITNLGGASTAAGRATGTLIGGLAGGFAAGGPIGIAIGVTSGAIQALSGFIKDSGEAAKKAADENRKWQENLRKEIRQTIDDIRILNAELSGGQGGALRERGAIGVSRAKENLAAADKGVTDAQKALAEAKDNPLRWDNSGIEDAKTKLSQAIDEREKALLAFQKAETENIKASRDAAKADKDAAKSAAAEAAQAAKTAKEAADKAAAIALGRAEDGAAGLLIDVSDPSKSTVPLEAEKLGAQAKRDAANKGKGALEGLATFDSGAALDKSNEALGKGVLKDTKSDIDAIDAALLQTVKSGDALASIFGDVGEAFGGTAGSMMGSFGKLIQQAIQLGIAMSASAGPFGWLNVAAAAAAIVGTVASIPEFRAKGGPVVAGMPYIVGEKGPELMVPGQSGTVVPNDRLGGGGITINLQAWDGPSVRRTLERNSRDVRRALNQMAKDGR